MEKKPFSEDPYSPYQNLLIVLEGKGNVLFFERLLKLSRFSISEAFSVEDALCQIMLAERNQEPIQLIITEAEMPNFTGVNLKETLAREGIEIPLFLLNDDNCRTLIKRLSACAGEGARRAA